MHDVTQLRELVPMAQSVAATKQELHKPMLDCIEFMGQLYKRKLLSKKLILAYIMMMEEDLVSPHSADLECLHKLMTLVGRWVDILRYCFFALSTLHDPKLRLSQSQPRLQDNGNVF